MQEAWISVLETWISMLEYMLAWILIMDINVSMALKIHAEHGYPWCSFGSMDSSMDIHAGMDFDHGYPCQYRFENPCCTWISVVQFW